MPPGLLEIKEKSYLTDVPPSDMPANTETISAKTVTLSYRVESCYIAAAAATTYMPVGLVLLSQTPLLFKHAYWLNTAASLQDGCLLDCGHSISMSADLLSLSIACLRALHFYIFYTCWYGVLLSVVSAGIVSHY